VERALPYALSDTDAGSSTNTLDDIFWLLAFALLEDAPVVDLLKHGTALTNIEFWLRRVCSERLYAGKVPLAKQRQNRSFLNNAGLAMPECGQ
jgi:hypothetical protein